MQASTCPLGYDLNTEIDTDNIPIGHIPKGTQMLAMLVIIVADAPRQSAGANSTYLTASLPLTPYSKQLIKFYT
jgi:hypothetical protein